MDNSTMLILFFGIFFGSAILLAIVVFVAQGRMMKSKREHELEMERIDIEKEKMQKEVLMVTCQYCGGLMTQSSTSCPHCKAKRTV